MGILKEGDEFQVERREVGQVDETTRALESIQRERGLAPSVRSNVWTRETLMRVAKASLKSVLDETQSMDRKIQEDHSPVLSRPFTTFNTSIARQVLQDSFTLRRIEENYGPNLHFAGEYARSEWSRECDTDRSAIERSVSIRELLTAQSKKTGIDPYKLLEVANFRIGGLVSDMRTTVNHVLPETDKTQLKKIMAEETVALGLIKAAQEATRDSIQTPREFLSEALGCKTDDLRPEMSIYGKLIGYVRRGLANRMNVMRNWGDFTTIERHYVLTGHAELDSPINILGKNLEDLGYGTSKFKHLAGTGNI